MVQTQQEIDKEKAAKEAALFQPEPVVPLTDAKAASTQGFKDPDLIYPKPSLIQESDTNRLARGEFLSRTVIGEKEISKVNNVRVAGTHDVWHEPTPSANPTYPHNQVKVSKGGIIDERDSTPGNIRIHQFHPSGTFREVDHTGTTINKIVGDNFLILERNGHVTIEGACNITVKGNCNLLVNNNLTAEVDGNADIIVKNDLNTTVHGNSNHYVQGEFNMKCKNFNLETFDGDVNILSAHNIDMKCVDNFDVDVGKKISINSMDSITMVTETTCSLRSKSTFNVNTSDTLLMQSAEKTSIKAGPSVDIDATDVFIKAGKAVSSNKPGIIHMELPTLKGTVPLPNTPEVVRIRDLVTPTLLGDKLVRQVIYTPPVKVLQPVSNRFAGKNRRYECPDSDLDPAKESTMKDLEEKQPNVVKVPAPVPSEVHPTPTTKPTPKVDTNTYDKFENEVDIPKGTQLSTHYSLMQLLGGDDRITKVRAQQGLSEGQIIQNLQYLAVNVLEVIRNEYSGMHIHSGYRYQKGGDKSKHNMGMAVDMGFTGSSRSDYYAIAKRITEILPSFDQVILEYGVGNSQWIHVSFNKSNQRREIYTYWQGKNTGAGLHKLA